MDLPIENASDQELELGLEPEGDSISLAPGDRCIVRFVDAEDPGSLDLDIKYKGTFVSIGAMSSKEVFLNGQRIR